MTPAAAIALPGWALAAVALVLLARARAAHAGRAELVARACHEVRGPLQAVGLAVHALARGDTGPPGRAAARAAAIDLELRRAHLALEDLQRAPRGARRRDRAELVDVGALVRRQAAAWQSAAGARGTAVVVRGAAEPLLVHGDRLRLAQATGNLVANALEHGDGPVELHLRATAGHVRVEVADAGPGLPAPVAAIAARAGRDGGRRGRGLAITAEVAARHGGRLAAAPAPRGARLVLELPRAAAPAAVRRAPA